MSFCSIGACWGRLRVHLCREGAPFSGPACILPGTSEFFPCYFTVAYVVKSFSLNLNYSFSELRKCGAERFWIWPNKTVFARRKSLENIFAGNEFVFQSNFWMHIKENFQKKMKCKNTPNVFIFNALRCSTKAVFFSGRIQFWKHGVWFAVRRYGNCIPIPLRLRVYLLVSGR